MISLERNRLIDDVWEIVQVEDFSIFEEFDCGDGDLNDFIRNDAKTHKDELCAETYLLKFHDIETPPLAFISLLNDSIKLETPRQRKLVPNRIRLYKDYPAVKIGRLGVMAGLQGRNVGTQFLDITKKLFRTNNRTGCRFITVEAYKRKKVLSFYQYNGFKFFPLPDEEPEDEEEETKFMYFDLASYRVS